MNFGDCVLDLSTEEDYDRHHKRSDDTQSHSFGDWPMTQLEQGRRWEAMVENMMPQPEVLERFEPIEYSVQQFRTLGYLDDDQLNTVNTTNGHSTTTGANIDYHATDVQEEPYDELDIEDLKKLFPALIVPTEYQHEVLSPMAWTARTEWPLYRPWTLMRMDGRKIG
jgi:hypothetical protein